MPSRIEARRELNSVRMQFLDPVAWNPECKSGKRVGQRSQKIMGWLSQGRTGCTHENNVRIIYSASQKKQDQCSSVSHFLLSLIAVHSSLTIGHKLNPGSGVNGEQHLVRSTILLSGRCFVLQHDIQFCFSQDLLWIQIISKQNLPLSPTLILWCMRMYILSAHMPVCRHREARAECLVSYVTSNKQQPRAFSHLLMLLDVLTDSLASHGSS